MCGVGWLLMGWGYYSTCQLPIDCKVEINEVDEAAILGTVDGCIRWTISFKSELRSVLVPSPNILNPDCIYIRNRAILTRPRQFPSKTEPRVAETSYPPDLPIWRSLMVIYTLNLPIGVPRWCESIHHPSSIISPSSLFSFTFLLSILPRTTMTAHCVPPAQLNHPPNQQSRHWTVYP